MLIKEWIIRELEKNGRDWVCNNYEKALRECDNSVGSETYMRYIRELTHYNAVSLPDFPRVDYEQKKDDINYTVISSDIRTLEQLIDYCRVDMTKWEVSKFICNAWGSDTNPNYQCKAWFTKKKVESLEDVKESLIEDMRQYVPTYPQIFYPEKTAHNALEINILDLHYGQLSWGEETGRDYDIKIAEELFMNSIFHFASVAKLYNIEKIVLPIGQDFFNVNSPENMTANGTLQDEDTRFLKTYTNARRMVVKAVDYLMNIAPVDIFIVPGNHDTNRTHYLGDSLFCWYHNCDSVTVDNSPKTRKYWKYGNNLIGFSHGNNEKFEELPLIMATERREDWGTVKYKEWHTGHTHKNEIMEKQDIRIRRIPSMVANSAWASCKGYNSIREAQAFLWNKDKGLTMVVNYRI